MFEIKTKRNGDSHAEQVYLSFRQLPRNIQGRNVWGKIVLVPGIPALE
jgi:hypothetical protein